MDFKVISIIFIGIALIYQETYTQVLEEQTQDGENLQVSEGETKTPGLGPEILKRFPRGKSTRKHGSRGNSRKKSRPRQTEYIQDQIRKGEDILLPNVGLHLKKLSWMEATRESLMLYIKAPLPNITDLMNTLYNLQVNKPIESCNLRRYSLSRVKLTVARICSGRFNVLKSLRQSVAQTMKIAEYKLDILEKYIFQLRIERKYRAHYSELSGIKNPFEWYNINSNDPRPKNRNKRVMWEVLQ